MSEWGVFGVIVAVVGLVITIMGPVVYVTKTLSKLTAVTEQMQSKQLDDQKLNMQSHDKLWAHSNEQDVKLNDHETRIRILESEE